jgi:hypothetical protein
MNEPWSLTAADALAAMRAKDLSPVELLESVIARAEAVEPIVNAFAERRYDEATAAARASADRYASGTRIRPLEGLPVALKEEVSYADGGCATVPWRSTRWRSSLALGERILKAGRSCMRVPPRPNSRAPASPTRRCGA